MNKNTFKAKNAKMGFTLAELLIVVAIIAVLVAIAIPVFRKQLEKGRESTDLANVRSAYSEVVTAYLGDGNSKTATVSAKQKIDGWQIDGSNASTTVGTDINISGASNTGAIKVPAKTSGTYTISITKDGKVSVQ